MSQSRLLPISAGPVDESVGLVHKPTSNFGRPHSSGLYAIDSWSTVESVTVVSSLSTIMEPPCKLVVRTSTVDRITEAVTAHVACTGSDSEQMSQRLHATISALLKEINLKAEAYRRIKVITSNPATRSVTGNTTDGLHFDEEQEHHPRRMGINLGPIPRYIYFVPRAKPAFGIMDKVVREEQYAKIARGNSVFAWRFRVEPGEGWLMNTEQFLHDGRRAVADGKSMFALMEVSSYAA